MFGRSLLFGLVVGIGVGIYVAPYLVPNGLDRTIKQIDSSTIAQTRKPAVSVEWPTNQIAKEELFRFSNWNFAAYGKNSVTNVIRCIHISQQSVACELSASLSWLDDT